MKIDLESRVRDVVGGKTEQVLNKAFNISTVRDLLMHFPRRYARRGELTELSTLRVGEHVTVMAEVEQVSTRTMRNRKGSMIEVIVSDGSDSIELTFFNQPWRAKTLREGRTGLFAGKVNQYRDKVQLVNPECILVSDGESDDVEAAEAFASELIPVYKATGSLPAWRIAQTIRLVLDQIDWDVVEDPLPPGLVQDHGLLSVRAAVEAIHRPESLEDLDLAKLRFKWEEALSLQLVLAARRGQVAEGRVTVMPRVSGGLLDGLDDRLPFDLTSGQIHVDAEIASDMASGTAMHRLLQGEVGSGKTLVALRAMLTAVDNGSQAALLAPTEVLAQQHYNSIQDLLGSAGMSGTLMGLETGTQVVLVTGSQKTAQRREALSHLASGEAGIVVGTHALLEDKVIAADLGLIVVDEQHRFGVEQRARLVEKANETRPHVLVMTATPIPRTVAMTVFGDLEVSTLGELPGGRKDIESFVVLTKERPDHFARVWTRIREEVEQGRQAFVVCTRIADKDDPESKKERESSEYIDSESEADRPEPLGVLEVAQQLETGPLKGLRIGILHGRMTPVEKELAMSQFRGDPSDPDSSPTLDVLVATTIVEVGVDVPNATVMAILDADRLGISQLHQLRGRVGRGEHGGLCLFVSQVPSDSEAVERLNIVASTNDGFELAEADLEFRSEGNILGSVQSGFKSSLRALSLRSDAELIAEAGERAEAILDEDSSMAEHPVLKDLVDELVGGDGVNWLRRS